MANNDNVDFEDDRALLNKDSQMRRRYFKWLNKRREDFDSDAAYDDYLEMVEDVIHKLVNNIDVESTKDFVEKYRQQNQLLIGQNQAKRAEETRREAEKITQMERTHVEHLTELRRQDAQQEEEKQRQRQQEHAEEILRISKGEEALAKYRHKREKAERKKRKKEAAAARAIEEKAKADEMAVRVRPCFPHPPPAPISDANITQDRRPMERKDQLEAALLAKAAKASGFQQRLVYYRALEEFTQSLEYAEQRLNQIC